MREFWGKYVCAFFLLLSRIEAESWGPGAPATQGSLERHVNSRSKYDSEKPMQERMCFAHGVIPRMAEYDDENEEAIAPHGHHAHHHSSHSLGAVQHMQSVHGSPHGASGHHYSHGEARHALPHREAKHAVPHGESRLVAPNRDVGHHSSFIGEPEREDAIGEIQSGLGVTHSGHTHQHSHQTPKDTAPFEGVPVYGVNFGKSSVSIPKREAPICWLCAGRHRAVKRSVPSYTKVEGYPPIDGYRLPQYAPQGDYINYNEKNTIGYHPHQHHHHHHQHHQIAQPQEYAPIASPDESLESGGNECGVGNPGECAAQLEDGGESSLRKKSVKIYQHSEDSLTSPLVEQKRSVGSNLTMAKPNEHAGICSGGNCTNCNNNLESPYSDEGPLLGGGRIARSYSDVHLGNCRKINKREAHIGRQKSIKHHHPNHHPHHHHCHYEM